MKKWFLLLACFLMIFTALSASPAKGESAPVISFDSTAVTLVKGKSVRLTPSAQNIDKSVRLKYAWESSDENVVKVTNGTLKAIDGGRAVVTCSTELPDGSLLQAAVEVEVTVPVSAIRLTSPNSLTIRKGETGKADYVLSPQNATDPSLEWSSSDESVATVDSDGTIHAQAAGSAKIVAATKDGSKKKVQFTVYVPSLWCSAGSVNIDSPEGASVEINYDGSSWDTDVTLTPNGDVFTFDITGGDGRYAVRMMPVAGGSGSLTINNKKDPKSKIVLNVTVGRTAIPENRYIVFTDVTCKNGSVRFGYRNNCGADIAECSFVMIPYNESGEQVWYYDTPGVEPRTYKNKTFLKRGAKTSVSAWIGTEAQDKSVDHVDIAMDAVRLADGTVIKLPDVALSWYSSGEKSYLPAPESISGNTQPEESVLETAKEFKVGYVSIRLRDWMKEHYGYHFGGEIVSVVTPDSIAEKAGLKAGDLIISVDGLKTVEDNYNVEKGVAKIAEGESVVFTVERVGEPEPIDLVFSK